jgi:UDP-GlcNAc:undecaprenyl-phosphate/decaprenyl-phosphate GlcNAc-1-phosphate transferase
MEANSMLLAFTATTLAFILNLYLIPFLIYLSRKKNWFDDASDARKIHTGQISRLGGIGIIFSLTIATIVTSFGTAKLLQSISSFSPNFEFNIYLILSGLYLIFLIGILDDFTDLRARLKLSGQIAAALLVILGGAGIRAVTIPFTEITIQTGIFSPLLSLIWLVGVANAINLIDGMDGLSAGISSMAAFIFAIVFLLQGQIFLSIFCFTLLGSIFGYLFYNFPPAKIFMGDSGSLTLGFLLALLPLLASPKSGVSLIMPITMLAIPMADVLAAMIRRKRKGLHFFTPDRSHMHHKLLDMGFDEREILSLIIGIQAFSGFSVFLFVKIPGVLRYIPILLSLILVLILFLFLHYKYNKRK